MSLFKTVLKNGRYQTLNERGTPIDTLWRDHRCMICQRPLDAKQHTFCTKCNYQTPRMCMYNDCPKAAAYRVTSPDQHYGTLLCATHTTIDPDFTYEALQPPKPPEFLS